MPFKRHIKIKGQAPPEPEPPAATPAVVVGIKDGEKRPTIRIDVMQCFRIGEVRMEARGYELPRLILSGVRKNDDYERTWDALYEFCSASPGTQHTMVELVFRGEVWFLHSAQFYRDTDHGDHVSMTGAERRIVYGIDEYFELELVK